MWRSRAAAFDAEDVRWERMSGNTETPKADPVASELGSRASRSRSRGRRGWRKLSRHAAKEGRARGRKSFRGGAEGTADRGRSRRPESPREDSDEEKTAEPARSPSSISGASRHTLDEVNSASTGSFENGSRPSEGRPKSVGSKIASFVRRVSSGLGSSGEDDLTVRRTPDKTWLKRWSPRRRTPRAPTDTPPRPPRTPGTPLRLPSPRYPFNSSSPRLRLSASPRKNLSDFMGSAASSSRADDSSDASVQRSTPRGHSWKRQDSAFSPRAAAAGGGAGENAEGYGPCVSVDMDEELKQYTMEKSYGPAAPSDLFPSEPDSDDDSFDLDANRLRDAQVEQIEELKRERKRLAEDFRVLKTYNTLETIVVDALAHEEKLLGVLRAEVAFLKDKLGEIGRWNDTIEEIVFVKISGRGEDVDTAPWRNGRDA